MKQMFLSILMALVIGQAHAAEPNSKHLSLYAGQESRPIKSLSKSDIAELRQGKGWGLAKAAELNGVPGPAHLLELKSEIRLSTDQISAIERIYAQMNKEAIAEGQVLISLEAKLESDFKSGRIDVKGLRKHLKNIGESRTRLRFIHLATHLKTPAILSRAQISQYNRLRGYEADPCQSIPKGHNAKMWRKHNGCDAGS